MINCLVFGFFFKFSASIERSEVALTYGQNALLCFMTSESHFLKST